MLSVARYKKALPLLSGPRRKILMKLYTYGPFINTIYIAQRLDYPNIGSVNVQVGTLGKRISIYANYTPTETYTHSGIERPSYYTLVHEYGKDGWDLQTNLRRAIEELGWANANTPDDYQRLETEEISVNRQLIREGKLLQVLVNRYERDPKARKIAQKLLGRTCIGCKINFKVVYGVDIADIIHFHHLRELGKLKKEEVKNIAKDLVPLCPNCHSVVHSTKKLMTIKELQKRIERNK